MDTGPAARQEWVWAWGAVGLAALPVLGALPGPIGGVDPPQYAEIGRELFEGHRWLPLRDAYGPYLDKPPLTFWLMRVAFWVFGPTPLAARLPALLGLALTVVALAWLGRRLYGSPAGVWAGALLLSTPLVQLGIADPKIDLVLLGPLSLAIAFGVASRRNPLWLLPTWLAAALAFLTKGPVGLLLPAAALLPEALRDPARGRSLAARLVGLRVGLGAALVALLAWPFYRSVQREQGQGGVRFLLWDQSFGRIFERGYHNPTGPLFFFHTLLWAALPATVALGFALVAAFRSWRSHQMPRGLEPREDRVPLWWFGAGLAGIPLSSYKLPQYLLWPLPGGLLFAAHWMRTWAQGAAQGSAQGSYRPALFPRIQLAVSVAAPLALAAFAQWSFPGGGGALGSVLLLAAGLIALHARGGALLRGFGIPLLSGCATGLILIAWIHPALMRYDAGAVLGRAASATGASEVLTYGGDANPAIAFACGCRNRAVGLPELVAAAAGHPSLLVAPTRAEPALRAAGLTLEPLAEVDSFLVAMPTVRFLNPATRASTLDPWRLSRVSRSTGAVIE